MSKTGQCLCGEIEYHLDNPPAVPGVCHCKNCQRQTGSAFSTIAGVPVSEFHITEGQPKLYIDENTDSGDAVERFFCGNCGSPIYSKVPSQAEMIYLKTGTLNDTSDFAPQFHVWSGSKQNWVELAEGVPAMPKSPG